jgi:uncharacterized repeat protein (TIGR03803 family)
MMRQHVQSSPAKDFPSGDRSYPWGWLMRANPPFYLCLAPLMLYLLGQGAAHAATESIVFTFTGGSDGALPKAGLTAVGGMLSGTTVQGGDPSCSADKTPKGCGTVFQVTIGGVETVLHAFIDTPKEDDGLYPQGELTKLGSSLFGATSDGSVFTGEIYRVNSAGSLKVLHTFQVNPDGSYNPSDGSGPNGALINVGGTLYGTTLLGGGTGCGGYGCGTVFKITTGAVESVVYSFKGGTDGSYPNGLVNVAGTLYGTNHYGGPANAGTVFKVTTSGIESVIYSFQGGADGSYPVGTLISVGGVLYGTTQSGGPAGYGTVYNVTKKGAETVLHAFTGGSDGLCPNGSLINVGGTLVGTTVNGGGSSTCAGGCGTVFQVTP